MGLWRGKREGWEPGDYVGTAPKPTKQQRAGKQAGASEDGTQADERRQAQQQASGGAPGYLARWSVRLLHDARKGVLRLSRF